MPDSSCSDPPSTSPPSLSQSRPEISSTWNKFYILGAAGGPTPTAEDLYYNWAVIHAVLFLASPSPIRNFVRYAQNYVNPDVPDEARLVRAHPSIRFRIMSDHWAPTWQNVINSIEDLSYGRRLGRHHFSDPQALRFFFGRGGPVYRSAGFNHPASLTIAHWLGQPQGLSRVEAIEKLERHKHIVVSKLQELNRDCKYTIDVCDGKHDEEVRGSSLGTFPRSHFAVEEIQFTSKQGGFAFTEQFGDELRASYASFIDLETSLSVYAVERIVLDFTDESVRPPPAFFVPEHAGLWFCRSITGSGLGQESSIWREGNEHLSTCASKLREILFSYRRKNQNAKCMAIAGQMSTVDQVLQ